MESYRDCVTETYAELAESQTSSFLLLSPVELLVVISLVREWVFVRPADADAILLEERWEDPALARWDMTRRADHEERVRQVVGIDGDFVLLQASDMNMLSDPNKPPVFHEGNSLFQARELTDRHASTALSIPKIKRITDALAGRSMDEAALAELRARLADMEKEAGRIRGYRFESWFIDLLAAHGCQVEGGKNKGGEQVDVFVHKPFRAIIECRWKKGRLEPRELNDLTAKLTRRPAIVAGVYVAMSGFTDSTRDHALHEGTGRTVLLWQAADVYRLARGEVHALDLYEEHVSDRVRRYTGDD